MQQRNSVNWIIHWWFTPKLPANYIWIPPERRPKTAGKLVRVYFRTWLVHPLKRRIAKYYLRLLQKFFGLKVIAISGSSGKTTTKDMLASILAQKGQVVASYANIDPVFNIPTTILKCKPSTQYLILEMGVEMPNEMDFYLWLANPDLAVVTNVYQTHTQFFGDTDGVTREKSKLARFLKKDAILVLNSENSYTKRMGTNTRAKVVYFGRGGLAQAENTKISIKGTKYALLIQDNKTQINLPMIGEHFVANSLAAAAVGSMFGLTLEQIKSGLEELNPPDHRLKVIRLKNGATILDDSYNNNPSAAKATLETFAQIWNGHTPIAVLGDMLELGKKEVEKHREIGDLVSSIGIKKLIGVGNLSRHTVKSAEAKLGKDNVFWAQDYLSAFKLLKPILKANTITLIKGSRSIGLDNLVSMLK